MAGEQALRLWRLLALIVLSIGVWRVAILVRCLQANPTPRQDSAATEASPTPEETLKWLVEKVEAAGYHYCQFQGKNLVCQTIHYESVAAGDCKLTFTFVSEPSAAGAQMYSKRDALSLWRSKQDISVSPSAFRCDKPCRKDFGDREIFFVGRPKVAGIYFASREVADRVAKAMNHAIALCGKEPF